LNGWIPLHRKIINHWIYKDADLLKAWVEILARARYHIDPVTEVYEGIVYTLNYAEFIFGRTSWSRRLNIGEQKLRTLIRNLRDEDMIRVSRKYSKFTIYFITNFEKYNQQKNHRGDLENQGLEDNNNQQENQQPTSSQPAANQQPTTNQQGKQSKQVNKDNILSSKQFADDSVPMILADKLKQKILNNNPKAKTPTNLQPWAVEIDRMIRIDNRTPEEISLVINFCQSDAFWMSNILSAKKLREKFDTLSLQAVRAGPGNGPQERLPDPGILKLREELWTPKNLNSD